MAGITRDLDVVRKLEGVGVVHNFAIGAHQGVGIEGGVTHQHLVQKHPYTPPVTLPAIAPFPSLALEHLRRDVVRGAHSGV